MYGLKYRVLKTMLRPMNPSVTILLGLYNIVWGLWVANPWVNSFTPISLYSVMTAMSPEIVWGLAVVCIGAVVVHGAITRKRRSILTGTSMSALFWLFVSISYFLGYPADVSFLDSFVIASYSAFTYLNVKVNNPENDKNVTIP